MPLDMKPKNVRGKVKGNMQAPLYYARKRAKAKAEATAGTGGGLRNQTRQMGINMRVQLTTS